MKNNKLVVFTGPSGVGKATIEKKLFEDTSLGLCFSISATTRRARQGEKDHEHYYFISDEEFEKKIKNGDFIEWNAHFSHKYGTLKSEIERIQAENKTPFLEIDVNGAENIIKKFGKENIISIFVAPPSIEELKLRIKSRGTETEQEINERISRVNDEMSKIASFDNIVINDLVENAVFKIKEILRGNK